MKIELEDKRAFFGLVQLLKSENLHLEMNFGASVGVRSIFYGKFQSLGSQQPSMYACTKRIGRAKWCDMYLAHRPQKLVHKQF